MRKFYKIEDCQLPDVCSELQRILESLLSSHMPPLSNAVEGAILLLEAGDSLLDVAKELGRDIGSSLEGAFRIKGYLVGVILLGNSGEAISLVCPDLQGHAEGIRKLLIEHLTDGEGPL